MQAAGSPRAARRMQTTCRLTRIRLGWKITAFQHQACRSDMLQSIDGCAPCYATRGGAAGGATLRTEGVRMSSYTRRSFVLGTGGAAASLALAQFAGAPPAGAQDAVKATMQLGWIANVENSGEFVAQENGYYAAEGVDLTIEPGGPAVAVEPVVVSGKALV